MDCGGVALSVLDVRGGRGGVYAVEWGRGGVRR